MGVNIPENISEGNSFENAMKNSKSTGNTLRKTDELEEYRKLTIGVDSIIKDEIRQKIIDTSPTISSDK
jgi:hypothetical protein